MSDDNNNNLAYSLGYSNNPEEVKNWLRDAGFTGISNLQISTPKNNDCNALRTQVRDQAAEHGAFFFYEGDHDYGPQPMCNLYVFNYFLRPDRHVG